MFQINRHFKEQFRTATFEIISESSPFLNKNMGCSSNTLTRYRQSDFPENVTKFSWALNTLVNFFKRFNLLAGVSQSFLSWQLCLKKIFQIHQKSKQLELRNMYLLFQKFLMQNIVCPSYLFFNFHKRGSLELWEKFTEH